MIKTCKICGATSEEKPFYGKVPNRCAECHRQKVRENRAEKADYYRAYDAKRFQDDPRVKERIAKYLSTNQGKEASNKAKKKWQSENPEKRAAHVILGNAVKNGKITKPSTCEICGRGGKIHGYHNDYAFPLSVVWVCPPCHAEIHTHTANL